ncbi:MAG: hypothetical protein JST31_09250 [Actinobacteria bacterium]|nr:hypothetical protein [Actinomycetota bacterium]
MRKRLTFANVMSVIAVFVALGGVGYAAVKLPKNSVGTAQLKPSSVTGAKVRNGSLTGADIAAGTLGTVPRATSAAGADHATSADNAAYAQHAGSADHAARADSAANADELGGAPASAYLGAGSVRRIDVTLHRNAEPVTLLQAGPLSLRASCGEGGLAGTFLVVEAASGGVEPSIYRSVVLQHQIGSPGTQAEAESMPISSSFQLLLRVEATNTAVGTIVYSDADTTISIDYRALALSGGDCPFAGTAVIAN